jgi:hypothetical protein
MSRSKKCIFGNLIVLIAGILRPVYCSAQVAKVPGVSSQTDQVMFLNGDRLSGLLVEVSAESIRFKTVALGEVTIKWDSVREITSSNRWIVLNPQKSFEESAYRQFHQAVLRNVNGSIALKLDGAPDVPVEKQFDAQFGDQKPAPQQFSECLGPYPDDPFTLQETAWFLGINAPETMVNGTQSQQQLGGSASLDVCEKTRVNHSVVSVTGQHTRTWKIHQPSITTDTFDGSFAQQHMFRSPDGGGIYGIADMFFNTSLGMALQKSFGIGVFSPQFTKGRFSYSTKIDVRYFNERRYNVTPTLNLAGIRIDQQARYKVNRFSINGEAWINPMVNDAQALQGFARLAPAIAWTPWLCVSLSEEEDYLGNSPPGKRKNYLSSSLTLKIQHGEGDCK